MNFGGPPRYRGRPIICGLPGMWALIIKPGDILKRPRRLVVWSRVSGNAGTRNGAVVAPSLASPFLCIARRPACSCFALRCVGRTWTALPSRRECAPFRPPAPIRPIHPRQLLTLSFADELNRSNGATMTTQIQPPATKDSFAHAGARLSFQKRVEQDAKAAQRPQSPPRTTPLVSKLKASKQENGTQTKPVRRRIAPDPIALESTTANPPSAFSGALSAATAAAAQNSKQPSKPPPPPPRKMNSGKRPGPAQPQYSQDALLKPSSSLDRSCIVAAQMSVQRSNSSTLTNPTKSNRIDRQALPSDTLLSTSTGTSAISSPANSAVSLPTLESTSQFAAKAAKLSSAGSSQDERPETKNQAPDVSGMAARCIAKKRPPALPLAEIDKAARFGVILTRSVSPAPLHPELSSGHSSPQRNGRSIYRLPELALSEPVLPTKSPEPFRPPSKVYTVSPLVPFPLRPNVAHHDLSDGSSLADFGAVTAMSSRSSSARSLPVTNLENIESSGQTTYGNRRRHVHLKTTMRKESRPERHKHHNHPGPHAMTEHERKRYEGVWASNYGGDLSTSAEYLDNFVVREIWSRSHLPAEFLGHIW